MYKIIIFLFIVVLTNTLLGDVDFEYKIKPGTEEWKKLKTHDQMVEALQVPLETLKKMRTKKLIKFCLDYPLFSDIWAFNNLQDGFQQVKNNFNGFQELYSRPDLVSEALKYYSSLRPEEVLEKKNNLNRAQIRFNITMFELIINQVDFLNRTSEKQRDLIFKIASNNLKKKKEPSLQYSQIHLETSYYLAVKF